jgi:hypothetical protein
MTIKLVAGCLRGYFPKSSTCRDATIGKKVKINHSVTSTIVRPFGQTMVDFAIEGTISWGCGRTFSSHFTSGQPALKLAD